MKLQSGRQYTAQGDRLLTACGRIACTSGRPSCGEDSPRRPGPLRAHRRFSNRARPGASQEGSHPRARSTERRRALISRGGRRLAGCPAPGHVLPAQAEGRRRRPRRERPSASYHQGRPRPGPADIAGAAAGPLACVGGGRARAQELLPPAPVGASEESGPRAAEEPVRGGGAGPAQRAAAERGGAAREGARGGAAGRGRVAGRVHEAPGLRPARRAAPARGGEAEAGGREYACAEAGATGGYVGSIPDRRADQRSRQRPLSRGRHPRLHRALPPGVLQAL